MSLIDFAPAHPEHPLSAKPLKIGDVLALKIAAERLRRFNAGELDVFETEQDLHSVRAVLADAYLSQSAEIERLKAESAAYASTLRRCAVAVANLSELPMGEAVQAAGTAAFNTDLTSVCELVYDRVSHLECREAQLESSLAAARAELDVVHQLADPTIEWMCHKFGEPQAGSRNDKWNYRFANGLTWTIQEGGTDFASLNGGPALWTCAAVLAAVSQTKGGSQ
jgi:hypothetical protein